VGRAARAHTTTSTSRVAAVCSLRSHTATACSLLTDSIDEGAELVHRSPPNARIQRVQKKSSKFFLHHVVLHYAGKKKKGWEKKGCSFTSFFLHFAYKLPVNACNSLRSRSSSHATPRVLIRFETSLAQKKARINRNTTTTSFLFIQQYKSI
jgi:hypothetical protein